MNDKYKEFDANLLPQELGLSGEVVSDIYMRVNYLVSEGYIDWHRRDEALQKLMHKAAAQKSYK